MKDLGENLARLGTILLSKIGLNKSYENSKEFETETETDLKVGLKFRSAQLGYVLILTLVALPVILLGSRYVLDELNLIKVKTVNVSKTSTTVDKSENTITEAEDADRKKFYKKCAKEAAFAVAKKWNPGLTYKQQKWSMLQIADEIYNKAPTYYDDSLVSDAIPGIDVANEFEVTNRGAYTPLQIKPKNVLNLSPDKKQIEYEKKTTKFYRYNNTKTFSWSCSLLPYEALRNIWLTYRNRDISRFVTDYEDSLFKDYCLTTDDVNRPFSTSTHYCLTSVGLVGNTLGENYFETRAVKTYKERKVPNDTAVKIECEEDKIKVTTDDRDEGYAVPAECNVDIILSIPVNKAATNQDNRDNNTVTVGMPYVTTSGIPTDEAKNTPIYQISRAYQNFIKRFFYTRGVNVGIMPYSAAINGNPYHVLELNSDLLYTYYFLTAFYPFYSRSNESNFVFIPVSWSNSLFQGKTATGANSAVDTKNDSINFGRLSTPSKTSSGRKKALILTINKPDWFEPGELTYIGFDDDYSDTPAIESDTIRFDINYDDPKSKGKYADGTLYKEEIADNTKIKGPRKVLVYTTTRGSIFYTNGYYQCGSGNGMLIYPRKGLIKLVVAPKDGTNAGVIYFSNIDSDSSATERREYIVDKTIAFYIKPTQMRGTFIEFIMSNIKLVSAEITNRPYSWSEANQKPNFANGLRSPDRAAYINIMNMAAEGKFKYQTSDTSSMKYFSDITKTYKTPETSSMKYFSNTVGTSETPETSRTTENIGVNYGSIPVTTKQYSYLPPESNKWKKAQMLPQSTVSYDSDNTVESNDKGTDRSIAWQPEVYQGLPSSQNWRAVTYGDGYFVAVGHDNKAAYVSEDNLISDAIWIQMNLPSTFSVWNSVTYGDGYFVAISGNSAAYISKDDLRSGVTWTQMKLSSDASFWNSVTYGDGYFVAVSGDSNSAYISKDNLRSGAVWTPVKITAGHSWRSVTYGGGYFVAVAGDSNFAAYISKDNIGSEVTWTQMKLIDTLNRCWQSVTYGDGYFVAIAEGSNSAAYISEDNIGLGVIWTQMNLPTKFYSWNSIIYGDGYFVAVGRDNAAYISKNNLSPGAIWQQITLPISADWRTICYVNIAHRFVSLNYLGPELVFCGLTPDPDNYSQYLPPVSDKWQSISMQSKDYYYSAGWRSVAYGDGCFVSVRFDYGNTAIFIKLSDLKAGETTWTSMVLSVSRSWDSVTYGDGYFVANGGDCAAYISKDKLSAGAAWTQIKFPVSTGLWKAITYGDGYFVAVSDDSNFAAYISRNDLISEATWTKMRLIDMTKRHWFSVTYGGGYFVAVSNDNSLAAYISKNNLREGATWSQMKLIDSTNRYWHSITYGDGYFVAIADDSNSAAYINKDNISSGVIWTQMTLINKTNHYWCSVTYGNGCFYAIARDHNVAAYISTNDMISGSPWTQMDNIGNTTNSRNWYSVDYGDGCLVAVSYNSGNTFAYSFLNNSMTKESEVYKGLPASQNWRSVTYGDGYFVAIACSGNVAAYINKDDFRAGSTWTQTELIDITNREWQSVTYGDGYFVAVANNNNIAAYINKNDLKAGNTWTQTELIDTTNREWQSVTYGDGYFVAVANNSNIAAYINKNDLRAGKTWTQMELIDTTNCNWQSVTYGDGYFVAIANNNTIAAYINKSDLRVGITWTQMELIDTTNCNWQSVTYGDSYFVAVASNTAAYISKNNLGSGAAWTPMKLPSSYHWQSVTYGDGYFVAVADRGNFAAYISENNLKSGASWSQITLPMSATWKSICYGWNHYQQTKTPEENLVHKFVVVEDSGSNVAWCDLKLNKEIVSNQQLEYIYNDGFDGQNSTDSYYMVNHFDDMDFLKNEDLSKGYGKTDHKMPETVYNIDNSEIGAVLSNYIGDATQMAMPLDEILKNTGLSVQDYKLEIKDNGTTKVPMLYLKVSLPVNTALYNYRDLLTGDQMGYPYKFKDDSTGEIKTSHYPTDAVKKVTQDVCKKLKDDLGNDLRVYLIKFRPQDKYRHKISKEVRDFDYSYLDNCASERDNSAGTPITEAVNVAKDKYIYEIADTFDAQSKLNSALSAIAKDIKQWAKDSDQAHGARIVDTNDNVLYEEPFNVE